MKCPGAKLNARFSYVPLETALAPFGPSSVDCFGPRQERGVSLSALCYGIVDFPSVDQATKAFNHLQGRRIGSREMHWRLEFLDPADESCGGRKDVNKSQQRRATGVTDRRRPGTDIRGVIASNAAHNESIKTRA
jgi:RNA recognition motif. (a.k.a. RRM, RBD, or RNP domain)